MEVFVLNPIVTHANQNMNIRHVHNDKHGAQRIALLGLRPGLKTSIIPDDEIAAVKALFWEYHAIKKATSMYICRLKNQLRQVFPQYLPFFSKVNGKAFLAVLSQYPTPSVVLAAGVDALAEVIRKAAGKGEAMAVLGLGDHVWGALPNARERPAAGMLCRATGVGGGYQTAISAKPSPG